MTKDLFVSLLLLSSISCDWHVDDFVYSFGCNRPRVATIIKERRSQSFDSNYILFVGKYGGSMVNFREMAIKLGLKDAKGTGYVIPTTSDKWWDPPTGEQQLDASDRYYLFVPHNEKKNLPSQKIVLLYANGYIYLFKQGYPHGTVFEPR